MTEYMSKTELLEKMQDGYNAFEALLTDLDETQMTTPGVNGVWSIKDNLAHLTAWQERQLDLLEGVRRGEEPAARFTQGLSEDEINEQVYQENKDNPLAVVLTAFHSSYQQLLGAVQAMTDEELNRPITWLKDRPVWLWVAGDTYEHYEEHGGIIRNWLGRK